MNQYKVLSVIIQMSSAVPGDAFRKEIMKRMSYTVEETPSVGDAFDNSPLFYAEDVVSQCSRTPFGCQLMGGVVSVINSAWWFNHE